MKTSSFCAITLALAFGVYGQLPSDLPPLPTCAQDPLIAGITTDGCTTTDFECHCKTPSFLSGIQQSIPAACNAADTEAVWAIVEEVCVAFGSPVTLPVPGAGTPTTPAPETTTTPAPQTTTTPPPAATTTPAPEVTTTPTLGVTKSSTTLLTTTPAVITTKSTASGSGVPTGQTSSATVPGTKAPGAASTTKSGSSSATVPTKPAQYTGSASKNDAVGMSALMGAVVLGLAAAI